jgi:hypothetical protein
MKSKLIAVVLSFIVMIAITPLVFKSLMNKKFDSMLASWEMKGYKISQIEDKSTYLTTDRIFKVVIPGNKLDKSGYIKDVVLRVEAVFKNLPVTNVKFLGKVLKIDLSNPYDTEVLNKAIRDKIRFLVITPNFKVYKYKIFDSKILLGDTKFAFKGINGEFLYPGENSLKAKDILIGSVSKPIDFEVKNLINVYKKEKNVINQKEKFNFYITLNDSKLSLINTEINNIVYLYDKIKLILTISIQNADIFSVLRLSELNGKFNLSGIDLALINKIKTASQEEKKALILKIFEKGFKASAALNVKHIFVKNKDIGYLDLDVKATFYPTSDILQKLQADDLSFLDLKIKLKTTPEVATILMNSNPKLAFLFAFAKKDKYVELNAEIKKGKLFINGEEIKSN